jgi:hypothetical protein
MKKVIAFALTLSIALALGSQPAFAQAKKKAAAPADAAAAEVSKAADAAKAKTDKPLPMNSRADSIDASAKTFTHKTQDGKEVKHVVTDKTEIKNLGKDAAFADIKVGDYVSGLRRKKSDTEYEVVKITKFGPQVKKEGGKKKPEAKPKE